MKIKKTEIVTNENDNKKLTIEEIESFEGFKEYSHNEKQELINFYLQFIDNAF
jgi:hypothetical protein